MKKHEADSSIVFRHWTKANPQWSPSSAIETKDTRGETSMLFSEVKQEQIDYGLAIKSSKGVLLRVVAVAPGMPDFVWLRNAPAWIVIKYPRSIEIIDVESFVMERDRSKVKSLTSQRAGEISTISVKV